MPTNRGTTPAPLPGEVAGAIGALEFLTRYADVHCVVGVNANPAHLRIVLSHITAQAQQIEELREDINILWDNADQWEKRAEQVEAKRDALQCAYDKRGRHKERQAQHLHETRLKLRKVEEELRVLRGGK